MRKLNKVKQISLITALSILMFSDIAYAQINERALGTRVRICAVKGSVSTYHPDSPDNVCSLEQRKDRTKCRIFNRSTIVETGKDVVIEPNVFFGKTGPRIREHTVAEEWLLDIKRMIRTNRSMTKGRTINMDKVSTIPAPGR